MEPPATPQGVGFSLQQGSSRPPGGPNQAARQATYHMDRLISFAKDRRFDSSAKCEANGSLRDGNGVTRRKAFGGLGMTTAARQTGWRKGYHRDNELAANAMQWALWATGIGSSVQYFGEDGVTVTVTKLADVRPAEALAWYVGQETGVEVLVAF